MESQIEHTASEESRPPELAQVPKKRFQIEKIEERIAPADPSKKGAGGGRTSSGSTLGSYGSIY